MKLDPISAVQLAFELQRIDNDLTIRRKRAAILRKAGDALVRLKTDPSEPKWLLQHANQVDKDVVELQRQLYDGWARVEKHAAHQ